MPASTTKAHGAGAKPCRLCAFGLDHKNLEIDWPPPLLQSDRSSEQMTGPRASVTRIRTGLRGEPFLPQSCGHSRIFDLRRELVALPAKTKKSIPAVHVGTAELRLPKWTAWILKSPSARLRVCVSERARADEESRETRARQAKRSRARRVARETDAAGTPGRFTSRALAQDESREREREKAWGLVTLVRPVLSARTIHPPPEPHG
jgi:hypothetical protein